MTTDQELQKILESPEGARVESRMPLAGFPHRTKTQFHSMKTQFQRNPARKCLADNKIRRRVIVCNSERSGVIADFNGTGVNFPLSDLLARAGAEDSSTNRQPDLPNRQPRNRAGERLTASKTQSAAKKTHIDVRDPFIFNDFYACQSVRSTQIKTQRQCSRPTGA